MVIIAVVAAALVLAPSLSSNTVLAKKTSRCTVGESSTECHGNSGNTPAAHITCTAGNPPKPNHPNCSGS